MTEAEKYYRKHFKEDQELMGIDKEIISIMNGFQKELQENKTGAKLPVMERYSHDAPIISEVAHSIASTYLVKKYNSDTHREVCEMIAKIVNVCIDTSE